MCVHVYKYIYVHARTYYTCASLYLSECVRRNNRNDHATLRNIKQSMLVLMFVYVYMYLYIYIRTHIIPAHQQI